MTLPNMVAAAGAAFLMCGTTPSLAQTPTIGITARDAQELSAQELARRALGDVGAALIADVDRPAFGISPGDWAARRGQSPPSVPPILTRLTFYGVPHAASWGMCEQLTVIVEFRGERGADTPQTPSNIETRRAFGVVAPTVQPQHPYSQDYRQALDAQCEQQTAGRQYFPAEGSGDASAAARVTEYLSSLGAAGENPTFQFSCEDFGRACSDTSGLLQSLTWQGIRSIRAIPCDRTPHTVRFPRCFDVVYGVAIENGRRVQTLGYINLRVAAAFPIGPVEIESVQIERSSAVP